MAPIDPPFKTSYTDELNFWFWKDRYLDFPGSPLGNLPEQAETPTHSPQFFNFDHNTMISSPLDQESSSSDLLNRPIHLFVIF